MRVLRIGEADGDARYLFSRITGAVRLIDGTIVVANQGTNDIRWYSAKGEWLRTTGREGSGPGEFRGLRRLLVLPGDSVLAEDGLAARMTLYDRDGAVVRTWMISPAGDFVTPPPIGRLPDGSFVAMTERSLSPPPGHTLLDAILIRYRDGVILDTLAVLRGGERYSVTCGTASTPGLCNMGVPYGITAHAAVASGRVVFGNGERYELVRIDPRSGKRDTLRRGDAAPPLTAARRAYFIDSVAASVPPNRQALVRDRYSGAPARRTMPVFSAIIADDRGALWIARPQERGARHRAWDILDGDGRLVRRVSLPANLDVRSISGGHVIGVVRDEDDVEYIELHRLRQR